MEGSAAGSDSLPPFLAKTYEMVDDPSTNAVLSWSASGASFVVWNPMDFSRDLLPNYFKHNNFSSFIRQLNTYGFRKIDLDQWEFANDDFLRGQRHLLKNIHRRKPIYSHSSNHQGSEPLAEKERRDLQEVIEKLNRDRDTLIMDIQMHAQKKYEMDQKMQCLEERLLVMETHQRSLISSLSKKTQGVVFLTKFVQQSDHHSKKRRLPKVNLCENDDDMEEKQIGNVNQMQALPMHRMLDTEPFDNMESSLNSLENFFRDVSLAFGEDMSYDSTVPCAPSAVVLSEMRASSGETDPNLHSPSPKLHSSSACMGDVHSSSPDLAESASFSGSPLHAHPDLLTKISEIDVNSKPAVHEVGSSSRDQEEAAASTVPPTRVNDVFWEQFLTEHPGTSDVQEVQSERRDSDDKLNNGGKMGERGNFWWNRKSSNNLTEKIGSLASAEKT